MTNKNDLWMLTASGKHFDLRNPKPEDITIEDIALALARTCRYTGHSKRFYSVADHILDGRKYIDQKVVKYWDLHDAEEAYLGDIPTPLKKCLGPEFHKIQQGVHRAICERFELDPKFPWQVKQNDLRMLLAERAVLFDKRHLIKPWSVDMMLDPPHYEHVKVRRAWHWWFSYRKLLKVLKQYE